METTQEPYDIFGPPSAPYPSEYIALWAFVFLFVLLCATALLQRSKKKAQTKEQLKAMLGLLKEPTYWDSQHIRSTLAILVKTARRYECEQNLIAPVEQALYMDFRTAVDDEVKQHATILAAEVEKKINKQRLK